jgi:hypothetical protein
VATATVSLSSTTFATTVEPSDTLVNLASTSGIVPGVLLYCDRELLAVDRLTGIGTQAIVRRGQDGTAATRHATNATVWIGRGDQFYSSTPTGLPPAILPVYPYIDVRTGVIWVAQGDETGVGNAGRIWAAVTIAMVPGSLGNAQTVTTTPS